MTDIPIYTLNNDNAMMSITVKKDVPFRDIKKIVRGVIKEELKNSGVELNGGIVLTFNPPCWCCYFDMNLDDIPLEDLTCVCGKTKLIKHNKVK